MSSVTTGGSLLCCVQGSLTPMETRLRMVPRQFHVGGVTGKEVSQGEETRRNQLMGRGLPKRKSVEGVGRVLLVAR